MDPILGTIQLFGFNWAPVGWAVCDGRLLLISQYSALFALIGTTFGGDGRVNFGLPNLQGRVPVGTGNGQGLSPYSWGQVGGNENVTLVTNQIPQHNHAMMGSNDAQTVGAAGGNSLGSAPRGSSTGNIYAPGATSQVPMGSPTGMTGGNQPHTNIQPYLALTYCIALAGVYPSRG